MGLVHFPVYNKNYQKIASAITTLDLHDLSRLAKTYGVKKLFIITPLVDQQKLADRILSHWIKGYGSRYNRHRKEALELACVIPSIEMAVKTVYEGEGEAPLTIATDASERDCRSISYESARGLLLDDRAVILLLGTAWGLHGEALKLMDYVLDPILGRTGYNHLSVRAASAIILDRLAGHIR